MVRLIAFFACVLTVASVNVATGQIINPTCGSTASANPATVLVCPGGDGPTLTSRGATISITVLSNGQPLAGIPATDIWVIGCMDQLSLCGGSLSTNADAATDNQGQTTISGSIRASGCDEGLQVVVQSYLIHDPRDCSSQLCLPIKTRSPDMNGDQVVNLVDFSLFGLAYTPNPYSACADFNGDGQVQLIDFNMFASHFLHYCIQ